MMKRSVVLSFLVLLSILGTEFLGSLAAVASTDMGVADADHAFLQAVAKSDRAAVSKFLDGMLEWTDSQGRTRSKKELLEDWSALRGEGPVNIDVKTFDYGKIGFVSVGKDEVRFLRVWVKRPAGWRLFNSIETAMKGSAPLPSGGGDCYNPCKAIPFKAATDMDAQILDAWQKAKNDEWHPNSADWALRVTEEFVIISEHALRAKEERVALLAKQQQKQESGPPGDPVQSIRMFDFGNDAAVMLSLHHPYRGGKPYYNVRVWVLRSGRWQIAVSQQTVIESAAPVSAANSNANS